MSYSSYLSYTSYYRGLTETSKYRSRAIPANRARSRAKVTAPWPSRTITRAPGCD